MQSSTNGQRRNFDFDKARQVIHGLAGEQFLKIHMSLSRHLKGDGSCVLVLAYILNALSWKLKYAPTSKALETEEMWFKCPAKDIQQELGMSERRQARAIDELCETYGLIEKKYRKGPAPSYGNFLWIRVNTEKLDEITTHKSPSIRRNAGLHESCETQDCMSPAKRRIATQEELDNKKTLPAAPARPLRASPGRSGVTVHHNGSSNGTVNGTANGTAQHRQAAIKRSDGLVTKPVRDEAQQVADKLHDIISRHGKLAINAKPRTWPSPVRDELLPKKSFKSVMSLLDWYDKHIDDEFMPQACCGRSFVNKYHRIEQMMKRQKGESNGRRSDEPLCGELNELWFTDRAKYYRRRKELGMPTIDIDEE